MAISSKISLYLKHDIQLSVDAEMCETNFKNAALQNILALNANISADKEVSLFEKTLYILLFSNLNILRV